MNLQEFVKGEIKLSSGQVMAVLLQDVVDLSRCQRTGRKNPRLTWINRGGL